MKRTIFGLSFFVLSLCSVPYVQAAGDAAALSGVPYVTGGVGEEEWATLQEQANDYSLQLLFAQKVTGAYLAGVKVSIENAQRKQILAADDCGPRFLAKLPAGRYQLTVEYAGSQQKKLVGIGANQATKAVFYFP